MVLLVGYYICQITYLQGHLASTAHYTPLHDSSTLALILGCSHFSRKELK